MRPQDDEQPAGHPPAPRMRSCSPAQTSSVSLRTCSAGPLGGLHRLVFVVPFQVVFIRFHTGCQPIGPAQPLKHGRGLAIIQAGVITALAADELKCRVVVLDLASAGISGLATQERFPPQPCLRPSLHAALFADRPHVSSFFGSRAETRALPSIAGRSKLVVARVLPANASRLCRPSQSSQEGFKRRFGFPRMSLAAEITSDWHPARRH